MSSFTALTYTDHPEDFLRHLSDTEIEGLPSSEQFIFETRYRGAEHGDGFKDLSFCIVDEEKVEAFILAHKIHDQIGFNHTGVKIAEQSYRKKRENYCLEYLLEISAQEGCNTLKFNDYDVGSELSPFGLSLLYAKGTPHLKLQAVLDLSLSEENLFLELRASSRRISNKYKDLIKFNYVTSENLTQTLFDEFREFHKTISGRQTRPMESWNVQFEMIQAGQAELIMGYMEPHGLVSAALYTDFGSTTTYAVAVFERSKFDKPLGHMNVFQGILRAKHRGQKIFNVGLIPSYHPDHEKEYNIGQFKKGFCQIPTQFIEWHIFI
jgi:hypothetical protein